MSVCSALSRCCAEIYLSFGVFPVISNLQKLTIILKKHLEQTKTLNLTEMGNIKMLHGADWFLFYFFRNDTFYMKIKKTSLELTILSFFCIVLLTSLTSFSSFYCVNVYQKFTQLRWHIFLPYIIQHKPRSTVYVIQQSYIKTLSSLMGAISFDISATCHYFSQWKWLDLYSTSLKPLKTFISLFFKTFFWFCFVLICIFEFFFVLILVVFFLPFKLSFCLFLFLTDLNAFLSFKLHFSRFQLI